MSYERDQRLGTDTTERLVTAADARALRDHGITGWEMTPDGVYRLATPAGGSIAFGPDGEDPTCWDAHYTDSGGGEAQVGGTRDEVLAHIAAWVA
jgi:hypothetical protein